MSYPMAVLTLTIPMTEGHGLENMFLEFIVREVKNGFLTKTYSIPHRK